MNLRLFIYKITGLELTDERYEKLLQFIKFCFVGIINNLVYYVCYLILIKIGIHYTPANILGFSVSVFNAYYWNNRYVFISDGRRVWWRTLLKTYISYIGTGIILSNLLLLFWVEVCGISEIVAPLIDIVITMPVNFVVNKFWAYRNK